MAFDYSLRVFNPIVVQNPPSLVSDITTSAKNWKRSIRSEGGYWLGSFKLNGSIETLQDFFANRLGCHVEENAGVKTWEGLIYEMELQTASVTRRRSLDDMYNAIRIAYNDQNDEAQLSSYSTDAQSIARYGRREVTLAYDGAQQTTAEAYRDSFLKENALPWPRPVAVLRRTRQPQLNIKVCGYIFTANWKYITQTTELDKEIGTLAYLSGPARLQDQGQDFSEWETLSGDAHYSVFIVNDDDTVTSGWLGASSTTTNPNDTIAVYQDQGLTTAGWNGVSPSGKTAAAYLVYGPSSEWINDILSTDTDFISAGAIRQNLVQVKRALFINDRCWDVFDEIADFGSESSDKPWGVGVFNNRLARYEEIDTTPRYFIRNGEIFTDSSLQQRASPWLVQPGVFQDTEYPLGATGASNPWLSDARDIFIEEVEASQSGITLKPVTDFGESDILSEV